MGQDVRTNGPSQRRPAAALSTRAGPVPPAFPAAGGMNEYRTPDPQYFLPLSLNKREPERLTVCLLAHLILRVGSLLKKQRAFPTPSRTEDLHLGEKDRQKYVHECP